MQRTPSLCPFLCSSSHIVQFQKLSLHVIASPPRWTVRSSSGGILSDFGLQGTLMGVWFGSSQCLFCRFVNLDQRMELSDRHVFENLSSCHISRYSTCHAARCSTGPWSDLKPVRLCCGQGPCADLGCR